MSNSLGAVRLPSGQVIELVHSSDSPESSLGEHLARTPDLSVSAVEAQWLGRLDHTTVVRLILPFSGELHPTFQAFLKGRLRGRGPAVSLEGHLMHVSFLTNPGLDSDWFAALNFALGVCETLDLPAEALLSVEAPTRGDTGA